MFRNTDRFVAELRPEEPARFNPERLEDLCRRIGETRAEVEVARALDRISTTLGALPQLSDGGDASVLRAGLTTLIRDADLIGMATLARVARDVAHCLDNGDDRGRAATTARLIRVGDRSIHAVWELEDVSG
ncbi:hypothetical protein P6F26_00220 [Roseibacterium sp. SDUM158017]|uniref:hypothetical protein n=1 Tax=Roseicyclus salinarum TaxID=3036773 RepID=UPI0024156BCC|nr:hypothetical protein [Roseibacterium sp. SDUM158017]MDG4646853.1 hypothetical protein [Roseibacterium sp. SDUM158017]